MSVPDSVKQLLESHDVVYNMVDQPSARYDQWSLREQNLRRCGAIKSIILQDGSSKVLVIITTNSLLDLKALQQHSGRDFCAVNEKELTVFCDKHQLLSVPALPNLAGMKTYVDSAVLEQETILLDVGVSNEVLKISANDFSQLIDAAEIIDIAVCLDQLAAASEQADAEEQIFSAVKNFTSLRIKQRLEETLELPPLPETAQKIMQLRANPDADISDLANVVEMDPSLAAQVVSWASSPYYSAQGGIKSIHDAIVRILGFDMVMNLSLGLALGKTMNLPTDSPKDAAPYWQQAVYTAALVEGLVTVQPRDNRLSFGLAYLSGLLHNFGTLIMAEVFPPHYASICRHIEVNSHVPQHLIDQHILGVSREQISSWLMKVWNMPEEVVFSLRHQNHPYCKGEHENYAKLLFVAQAMLQSRGIGRGTALEIDSSILKELNLNPQMASNALDNLLASEEQLMGIASVLSGS